MPSGAQISLLPHLVKRQSVQTILQPLGDRAETKLDQERGEARLQHLLLRTKIILHPSVAISTLTLPFSLLTQGPNQTANSHPTIRMM